MQVYVGHKKSGLGKLRRESFSFLFFAVVVLFSALPIFAELLPIKSYTVADGLQRDEVKRIRRDSRGFMWFCTDDGISRFDGVGMTNFTTADGLPNRIVEDFLETKNGAIYIATDKGLARLNPLGLRGSAANPLFTVFLPDNPKAEKILTLMEGSAGQVWVGTSDGLYKLMEMGGEISFENVPLGTPLVVSGGGAIIASEPNSLYVKTILEDRHKTLWIGTFGSGLFRLSPDGSVRHFTAPAELPDNKITDLLEDSHGQLWMSLRSDKLGGVCLMDEKANEHPLKKCYTTKDGLDANWVRDIHETRDGQLWLATLSGLCRWQGEGNTPVCKNYSAKNGLCNHLLTLGEDNDGNLWTGSPCGAKKIARYGFTTYKGADGLFFDTVNSIFENSSGELFALAFPQTERIISRWDGDKFSLAKPNLPKNVDYHGWGWEKTVWQDSQGAWWIPSGYGLFRSPNKTNFENLDRVKLQKIATGAKDKEAFRLFEDSRGDIWILTVGDYYELLRWERAKNIWHNYTSQVGFSNFRIGTAVVEDHHGNIWIGASSDNGNSALIRYRNGQFRIVTQAEGAPSGSIMSLFVDSRGRLWIPSTNDGLRRLDETNSDHFEFTKYATANGLTSNATSAITEDVFGRIYIGTWQGIDRLNPDTGQIENFTTADGLPNDFVEVAYRDRHNNLWFGTHEGLAKFAPEPPRTRQPPTIGVPQVVSVLGETNIPQLELNAQQRQITVDFIGLGASLGEKLKYEYRLNDSDWTPTTERTVNFANLAASEYRFEVRAITADRIYSQTPAKFNFRIAAPLWQRWWFMLGVLLSTALVIYLFYKNRLARLLEMERMRTRIATDLHDDIGANLTRISLLSEVANQQTTNGNSNLLTSIAEIARESVASMNDIVWAISPDHDRLLDLTRRMRQHAEEVFTYREIDLKFNNPSSDSDLKLSVGVRRDVLLIFKEAVNNAARHSDCTKVEIDFACENSILSLQIKDNGKGFATDLESDGHGLRSMARRAKTLGGSLNIESQTDKGTSVKFALPLPKSTYAGA
jgi:signal transduction histidine kinase/streptogramin lyase